MYLKLCYFSLFLIHEGYEPPGRFVHPHYIIYFKKMCMLTIAMIYKCDAFVKGFKPLIKYFITL